MTAIILPRPRNSWRDRLRTVQLGIGARGTVGVGLAQQRGGAAEIPWWLLGGVAAANCVAAYQPKWAASLAASQVNLANPGTYDITWNGVTPGWNDTSGWMHATSGTPYQEEILIAANQSWSFLIRFSNKTAGQRLSGFMSGANYRLFAAPFWSATTLYYYNTTFGTRGAAISSGVSGMAANQPYANGSIDGVAFTAGTFTMDRYRFWTASEAFYVQAISIYNTTLTTPQMAAISAAMAAL